MNKTNIKRSRRTGNIPTELARHINYQTSDIPVIKALHLMSFGEDVADGSVRRALEHNKNVSYKLLSIIYEYYFNIKNKSS